ncbi:L,D-transpeptidase [Methylobacterium oxalidis]
MRIRSIWALCGTLAVVVSADPALADVRIAIDKSNQRMSVAVSGQTLYNWRVSTGLPGHGTPSGTFRVLRTERMYYSRKYDNAPMPNAIFFTSVGHAIHGTNHVRRLGRAASHGCVRLAPGNAATLFALVRAEGTANTRITIGGSIEPLIASRDSGFHTARTRRQPEPFYSRPAGLRSRTYGFEDDYYPARIRPYRDTHDYDIDDPLLNEFD